MTSAKKIFKSLLAVIFIDQLYITLTFPLVTLIFFDQQSRLFPEGTAYASRSVWYGMCVALPSVINVFFAPLLSVFSDEFGRKKILLIEIASAFIFTSLVGLGIYTGELLLVFLGFIVKGAFSRTNPTALAIIGDTAPREKKILYMSYLQFAIAVGASFGPILGGYFAMRFFFSVFNFSLPFLLAAMLALANTCFAYIFMTETLKKSADTRSRFNFTAFKNVAAKPSVLRISIILLLIQISWSTYYQFMPPALKTIYAFDAHELGWFLGMIALWLALTTGVGMKWLEKILDVRRMLLLAVYLVFIGLTITLISCRQLIPDSEWLAWIGAMPTAAGDVIAYSCLTALYSNVVSLDQQGRVMGISFFVVSGAWATTGFLGGILMSITPALPLIAAPIGIISAIILLHSEFGKNLIAGEENFNDIKERSSQNLGVKYPRFS